MSVFAAPIVTFYQAPLGISSHKVTVGGSWSLARFTGHMNTRVKFRMCLHVWKQQFDSSVASACLDWIVLDDSKNMLVLKLTSKKFGTCLQNETFMNHIQQILDNANIYHVHTIFNNYNPEN